MSADNLVLVIRVSDPDHIEELKAVGANDLKYLLSASGVIHADSIFIQHKKEKEKSNE